METTDDSFCGRRLAGRRRRRRRRPRRRRRGADTSTTGHWKERLFALVDVDRSWTWLK